MSQSSQLVLRAFSSTHSAERVLDYGTLIVGRGDEANLVLPDPTLELSRRHFEVRWEEGHCGIVDLDSVNGTFLEGIRLTPQKWTAWKLHQTLAAGPFDFSLSEIPSAAVNIAPEAVELSVKPGSKVNCKVTVTNTGARIERFNYDVSGAPAAWFGFDPPMLEINNGETKTFVLSIEPPLSPESEAGQYGLMLVVADQHQPEPQVKLHPLVLQVEPFEDTRVTCNPETIVAGEAAAIEIANLGNFPQEYVVNLRSRHTRLSLKRDRSKTIQLQPGKAGMVHYRAFERPRRLVGDPIHYGVQCELQSTRTGDTKERTVTVTASGCLSTWLASIVLGLLMVMIAVGLFLFNNALARQDKATEVAAATRAAQAEADAQRTASEAAARAEADLAATSTAAAATATTQWLLGDDDRDGLTNATELQIGTDPHLRDTDGDQLDDYLEVQIGTKPAGAGSRDSDGDGMEDGPDHQQCNAKLPDTDGDGVGDGAPKSKEPDCRNPDSNGNGIEDGAETGDPAAPPTPTETPTPTPTQTPIPPTPTPTPTPAPLVSTFVGNAGSDTDGCVRISWYIVGVKSVEIQIGDGEAVGVAGDNNNQLVTWDRQECFDESTDIRWDIEFHNRPPLTCTWEVQIDDGSGARREEYIQPADVANCVQY